DGRHLWIGIDDRVYLVDLDALARKPFDGERALLRAFPLPNGIQLQGKQGAPFYEGLGPAVSPNAFAEDDSGRLWVGTSDGLGVTDLRHAWLAPRLAESAGAASRKNGTEELF